MHYHYIAIEGNIGAGKTTLAHELADHFKAKLILEQFAENPFLPKFYVDKERFAFPLELSFLADRYKQLKEILQERKQEDTPLLADYALFKSPLFAKMNLPEEEFSLFHRMAEIMELNLPKPDLLIYLHSPIDKLQRQIRKRGRPYEQNISDQYLEAIQQGYHSYLEHYDHPLLIIENDQTDFNPAAVLEQTISFLASGVIFQKHHLKIV